MDRYKTLAVTPGQQGMRHAGLADAVAALPTDAQRVLRNTYGLLSLTLIFSAGVAAVSTALALPGPGLILVTGTCKLIHPGI